MIQQKISIGFLGMLSPNLASMLDHCFLFIRRFRSFVVVAHDSFPSFLKHAKFLFDFDSQVFQIIYT